MYPFGPQLEEPDGDPSPEDSVRIPVQRIDFQEGEEAAPPAEGDSQRERLDRLGAEVSEWKDRYLRLQADVENTKKRLERNYAARAEREIERALEDLLPLADNLERVLEHLRQSPGQHELYTGIELILKSFLDSMAKYGVKPIQARGEPFDPEVHEAVGIVHHPDFPPNTVAQVQERGYLRDDHLLRPAKVLVTPD